MVKTVMETQLANWVELARAGAGLAMVNLSRMTGRGIESSCDVLPVAEMARSMGGPATEVVGVHIALTGDASGHASGDVSGNVIFMYERDSANGFADLVMGREPGTARVLGEGEQRALAELGESVGASFLRVIADVAEVRLAASHPSVLVCDAGTALGTMADGTPRISSPTHVAEMTFFTGDREMWGVFLVAPRPELLRALSEERLTA
jgi:chemotaxis protein CheY-P-specific phosphatase CheC